MRQARKPGDGFQSLGCPDLRADQQRKSIKGRAAQAARVGRYCIEGEYVTVRDITARLGVAETTAEKRLRTAQKAPGAVTWAALGVKP